MRTDCELALHFPGLYWWVAPTYKTALIAFNRFKLYIGQICDINETQHTLKLPNGAIIQCISAHKPDNLRGEGVIHITLDEAAYIPKLNYVWYGVLRPMLIDTQGGMLALSTPNFRNLFYQWYLRGQDPLETDWASWSAPSTTNPYLPAAELAELEQEYPPGSELYRQELLGEFLEGSGQVFRHVREASTLSPRMPDEPMPGRTYIGGIDWGKSQDFTAVAVIDVGARTLVALERFNLVDYTLQRDRIRAMHAKWGVTQWWVESNAAGEPNIELLQRDDLPVVGFQTTAQSKRPLIEGLAQAFELGLLAIPPDPVLIGELESYERKVSANTGVATYSAPQGGHDDTVIALALAWWGAQRPGPANFVDFVETD